MNNIMNLWPIKKFITYILKRSLGKFLKNPVDLNQYDFTAKKVTFKQLDINVQVSYHIYINCIPIDH